MPDPPSTRSSLLLRLRDRADTRAWRDFTEIYEPLVYNYGRKRGLQDADAADLTQEVMRAVADGLARRSSDREGDSFRGWLFTLTHHKLYDLKARLRRQAQGTGDSDARERLDALPARDADEALWQQEHQQRLFEWAAQKARGTFQESTWRAFWLTAVEGKSGQEAAEGLGLTLAAVYLARSRVMARLRELIAQVEGEEWP